MSDRILRKIQKLMSLSQSSNANEAASALQKAAALMRKYDLTEADVSLAQYKQKLSAVRVAAKPPSWLIDLIGMICRGFGVKATHTWDADKQHYVAGFVGRTAHAEVAQYCYDVCLRQLKNERRAYLKSLNKMDRKRVHKADIFCHGWVNSVSDKLPYFDMEKEERILIAKKVQEITDGGKAIKSKQQVVTVETIEAFNSGKDAGDTFDVHAPVNGQSERKLLK